MLVSKSISIDGENTRDRSVATDLTSAFPAIETEFIERLKSGDAAAFDILINRYSSDIYAYLYRLTNDAEEAADLTQETFLNSLKAIRSFRGECELKTWLFRIAVNNSRNRFRWWKRRKLDKTISLESSFGENDAQLGDMLEAETATPEEELLRHERQESLERALHALPEIYREAIILCDIEGLTYEEISQTLNLNIGTVKSRIARGREELRRKLKDI